MSAFEIPPLQIDPGSLPPPLQTSDPRSFARETFETRVPLIIQDALAVNAFPTEIRAALEDLHAEITSGVIRALRETTPDRTFWDRAFRPHAGRTWFDVPWFWAEAFFYRRLLEATGYFGPGPWRGVDPFEKKKREELQPHAAPQLMEKTLCSLPADRCDRFQFLVHASLWGNRIDLSYPQVSEMGRTAGLRGETANVLVDDSRQVWDYLDSHRCRRVMILADNAGTELLTDLALSDFLLTEGCATQVTLQLKPQPFFVSDAMPSDVDAALTALTPGSQTARCLAHRIREHLTAARLRVRTHWLFTTNLFYFQLPDDLRKEIAASDFVIAKGDANYRRLLGDAHWPPTSDFHRVTAYFPAPFVTLRTLKSELIVGLRPGEAERLAAQDPKWLINGRRAVVQARCERGPFLNS
ncbi:MAG TPA: damage-control phosphatase ARMT1 family protein [bacterium]|nr:damage-control phosphatase ARMT1 family protein [bacterium]